jgi:hypothetical protein
MAEQGGWKRPTRADVLVLIATGLAFVFLVSALWAQPREQAVRTLCATNLSQIGKAMFLYAADHKGELPRAGGPTSIWGPVKWQAFDRWSAYTVDASGNGGLASIGSCFYLLVKYYEMPPRLFVCPDDANTVEFKLSDPPAGSVPASYKLADAWDFGPEPQKHCSYSYHIPFGVYALATSCDPNLAVAADRSPWLASPAGRGGFWADFLPESSGGNAERARAGNSVTHRSDGQNVLFLDGRVTFESRAYCGSASNIQSGKDNIYTISRFGVTGQGDPWGQPPTPGITQPTSREDSLLVHDPPFGVFTLTPRPGH